MKRTLPGINIQYPISRLILSGEKGIETRTYAIPLKYKNAPLFLIETPGKAGKFKARVIAIVKFGDPIAYANKKEFRKDFKRHRVTEGSEWDWKDKPKWGWPIISLVKLDRDIPLSSKRGIRFTKEVTVNI